MASVNRVTLIGHLGHSPELRRLPSGDAVVNLRIATTDIWKDRATGTRREETTWHQVNFFGREAEVCGRYLTKGSPVYVEGALRNRRYTDREGIERIVTEIRGLRMKMLGRRGEADAPPPPGTAAVDAGDGFEDDVPL